MRSSVRVRWALRGFGAVFALVALYVGMLAFPRPLFAHAARFGEFAVYADHPLPADVERMVEGARRRIAAMEHPRSGGSHRIFLCGDPRLYSVFTFLTRRSSNSLGIGLWGLHTIYVNETKVRRMAEAGGLPRHSRFDGDAAGVVAHEIAHFNAIEILGLRSALHVPVWKSEGYADQQANRVFAGRGGDDELADRIALLLDDGFWTHAHWPRSAFGWQVTVEYLDQVEGLGLREIADDDITEGGARRRMLAWYRDRGRTH